MVNELRVVIVVVVMIVMVVLVVTGCGDGGCSDSGCSGVCHDYRGSKGLVMVGGCMVELVLMVGNGRTSGDGGDKGNKY